MFHTQPLQSIVPDPYFHFIEEQCRQGHRRLAPWTTTDSTLLALASRYFPEVPLMHPEQLVKPDITPVEILPCSPATAPHCADPKSYFIAVGGPSAVTVALQAAIDGQPVLYLCDNPPGSPPIWSGSGFHGEPDVLTQAPAYTAGYFSISFILREILRHLAPVRDPEKIRDPDYPWLSLNLGEWLRNPRQWLEGLRVAWGNHCLAKQYTQALAAAETVSLLNQVKERAHLSEKYLEQLHQSVSGLLRKPRGSLHIAASARQLATLQWSAGILGKEGRHPRSLTAEEARHHYGFAPRGALAFMEKPHDFLLEPTFVNALTRDIAMKGGQVILGWRLAKIFVYTEGQPGGVLEFHEINARQEKKIHYRRFHQAHLSLGATPFIPRVHDLISVTGVSINALLRGLPLTGGPLVCGGSNHMVPLLPPRTLETRDPVTGEKGEEVVSFVRLSAGACVNPLDRGDRWYHYDAHHALHLLHRVQETLPPHARLQLLSIRGCNRVMGEEGRQVELHPVVTVNRQKFCCEAVTIQSGAGGGGLTQMGAVPGQMQ